MQLDPNAAGEEDAALRYSRCPEALCLHVVFGILQLRTEVTGHVSASGAVLQLRAVGLLDRKNPHRGAAPSSLRQGDEAPARSQGEMLLEHQVGEEARDQHAVRKGCLSQPSFAERALHLLLTSDS